MAEIKQQPRVWHLNWSDIRSLEGRGAYLYNPRGEMVAIIFEQDRPEAEGVTVKIMESLNATPSPTETDKEIVERYAEILNVAAGEDDISDTDNLSEEKARTILTRFLAEARGDVDVDKLWNKLIQVPVDRNNELTIVISKSELAAALSAQEPKVCEWVDDDPFWIISCQKVGLSHSFHEPVIVRKWKACPYCTNPIEVKEG